MRFYLTIRGKVHLIRSAVGPPYSSECGRQFHVVSGTLQEQRPYDAIRCASCARAAARARTAR